MTTLQTIIKSVFNIFAVFVLVQIILTSWSLYSGEYQADMSRAVEYAAGSLSSEEHNEMLSSFITISILAGAAFLFVTSILAWFTDRFKQWARWPFLVICGWQAFDSIYGVFDLDNMYPGMIETSDWLMGGVYCLVWLYLLYLAWQKSPNKSLQPTAESGG